MEIPDFFIAEIRKQIEDEQIMMTDANLRRSISRNLDKKKEYEDIITSCEENIDFSTRKFIETAQKKYKVSENEANTIVRTIKDEIQAQFSKQNLKFEAIIRKIEDSQKEMIAEIVSQISTENEEMYANLSQISDKEANKLIETLVSRLPANLPNKLEIEEQLKSLELGMSSKLKLSIPIIPMILSYEADFGGQWADAIPTIWRKSVDKIKQVFKGKK